MRALGIVRGKPGDINRVTIALVGIAWVPFFLLGFLTWLTTRAPEPWLLDTPAHVRLLVALPLVLLAEWALNRNWSMVINRLLSDRFIDRAEAQVARVVRRAGIYRDSALAEGLLLAFVVAAAIIGLSGWTPLNLDSSHELTAAGVYSKLVSRPCSSSCSSDSSGAGSSGPASSMASPGFP
jgi:hypothetical protein